MGHIRTVGGYLLCRGKNCRRSETRQFLGRSPKCHKADRRSYESGKTGAIRCQWGKHIIAKKEVNFNVCTHDLLSEAGVLAAQERSHKANEFEGDNVDSQPEFAFDGQYFLVMNEACSVDVLDESLYLYDSTIFSLTPAIQKRTSESLFWKIKKFTDQSYRFAHRKAIFHDEG